MQHKHYVLMIAIAMIPLIYFAGLTGADMKDDFVQPFGLLVHEGNRDQPVTRGKAIEVLMKYFASNRVDEIAITPQFTDVVKSAPVYPYLKTACRQQIIRCGKGKFNPQKPVSQQDFLLWFYTLYDFDHPDFLDKKYPNIKQDYLKAWVHSRRSNYLIDSKITYESMKEFLYRFEVSQLHEGKAYFDGMVLKEDDITTDLFETVTEARNVKDKLTAVIQDLSDSSRHTAAPKSRLIRRFNAYRDKVIQVEQELIEKNHPINKLPHMPEDIKQKVREHDLNDILGQFAYDYSHNAAYRKHNVTEGALSVNGRVVMPGETLNYLDALRSKGWDKFVYGWTVVGGKEKWEFGGGLSGSSTMVSLPSWLAGLELVKFSPHNIYYLDLYPKEYIGLDTTLYRPNKNLVVKNNTDSPVLYYVHNNKEAEVVTVYVIGNSDFKHYEVQGPIELGNKTYKWIRQGERLDGTMYRDERITKYWAVY